MAPREHAAPAATMESYFRDVAAALDGLVQAGETYTAGFAAECSDFVRMNRGKVRQPGTVVQRYLGIDLIRGARHATHYLSLTGDAAADRTAIAAAVAAARTALADAVDDPHLLLATDVHSSRDARGGPLPAAEAIVEATLESARGTDLVGLYAGGPVYRGFANSHGQRNWHEAHAFNFQWSLYHRADKAVKSALSGFSWDGAALAAKMDEARIELGHMANTPKTLAPGKYRAFLTPAAMEEIGSMMCWGGFSARALATKQSSLTRMQGNGDAQRLDPRVTITEATADGVAPAFQAEGFTRPARVPLIEAGRLVGSLVSPRTSREFGLETNGADGGEGPESLSMAPGTLAAKDALAALGTGLFVGNLHYLNYSDRPAARITGMTRFATFWVENGRIVAPVDVLRFDDTIYRMLGANLEALTAETELLLASDSYHQRQLASMRLPGALVSELTFTL
jgi:predicted Zn-dependent protease